MYKETKLMQTMPTATKKENQSGQALLLVLLAMAAITTLSLSIVSRSITQVEVTNRDEEALRAYSAAEAGIEKSLSNVAVGAGAPVEESLTVETETGSSSEVGNYEAEVTGFPENANEYVFPFELYSGESGSVWFATRDEADPNSIFLNCGLGDCYSENSFEICWGDPAASEEPAVEVHVIYQQGSRFHKATFAYDGQARGNGFSPANSTGCNIANEEFNYSATVDMRSAGINPQQAKLVRVKMHYNTTLPQKFGVSGGIFPAQGKKVTSTGNSGNSTRKIEAYLLNPVTPGVFGGTTVISRGNFSK